MVSKMPVTIRLESGTEIEGEVDEIILLIKELKLLEDDDILDVS